MQQGGAHVPGELLPSVVAIFPQFDYSGWMVQVVDLSTGEGLGLAPSSPARHYSALHIGE
jgi:hypothetical protein